MKLVSLLLLVSCLGLSACGQKGPLVPPPPANTQPAGTPAK